MGEKSMEIPPISSQLNEARGGGSWVCATVGSTRRVAWVAAVAMFHWIYDVAWTSLLTLRQGPKEDLGAQEMPGVGWLGGAWEWAGVGGLVVG